MTRPKVPDDKRQRTAQACESCKRRKQKCNGLKPCNTCDKRKLTCSYTPNDHGAGESIGSPTKRRHIEISSPSVSSTLDSSAISPVLRSNHEPTQPWDEVRNGQLKEESSTSTPPTLSGNEYARRELVSDFEAQSSRSTTNWQAEEAIIYTETRMLQDQTGRLLYMGDASTLSILQLIRIIVENTAGAEAGSPFIDDPKRHRIMENIIDFPENKKVPASLPDKQTTDILVDSYFTNTCGLIEVFDKRLFLESIEVCYADPPSASNYVLCHLYLVLALGLVLSAPVPGSEQETIIRRQQATRPDRAELFFRSARSMCDTDTGFEDADFWSVQALSLMTVYMLAVSKRNTAYAYLGMAVRSAYALGLHREETMNEFIFTEEQMIVRRNMWKSLFILDRYLAASLGRPTAIFEHDCSCEIRSDNAIGGQLRAEEPSLESIHSKSLDACVRSCYVIGDTLKIFSERKISTAKVQEIANGSSRDWGKASHTSLHRRQPSEAPKSAAEGIANLHVDLLSLHSLILLTRQLFIMHSWKLEEQRSGLKKQNAIYDSPMARYSEACVIASYRTIHLVQKVKEAKYLPQRNPFIIYFLFAASINVLMNQFASLYRAESYGKAIADAIAIMKYCAEIDPQAERLLEILEKFSKVVAKWTRDHTHPAPALSPDLSTLYSQRGTARLHRDHTGSISTLPNSQEQISSRNGSMSNTGSLSSSSRITLSELIAPRTTATATTTSTSTSVADTRMNGIVMSPSQTSAPFSISARPSISSHSMAESSDSMNEDTEFHFNSLWDFWSNHKPPASTGLPGIATLAPQFPPELSDNNTEYPVTPVSRIPITSIVGVSGGVPLYHSSSYA
ncbi:fungal-specific transcription factor domain-containing protein [Podospora appendiculata]|uniref:Fungal-specific transcription factor domain-containing protein n=1 Tax=Podospora appendiculata TaxID=314037 RepID=A0AAE0XFL3_9PEZI|nr:fungal-specific transcription factor domain-containing protein [Podospora appendiculata]